MSGPAGKHRARARWAAVASALAVLAPAAPAHAQSVLSEVRLGVLAHDVRALGGRENGADINGEVLFVSPVGEADVASFAPWLRWVLQPRPHLGFSANTLGYTSQFYAGLTWTATLATGLFQADDAIFFGYGFGPALNNGFANTTNPRRKQLGSNLLFHLTAELGYRFTPRWSMSLYFEHSSNADLATHNEGLNDAGLRVGWRF